MLNNCAFISFIYNQSREMSDTLTSNKATSWVAVVLLVLLMLQASSSIHCILW